MVNVLLTINIITVNAVNMHAVDVNAATYKSFGENTDHINKWLRNTKITKLYTDD